MTVFFIVSLLCAAAGAFLIFDFCLWSFTGKVVLATIEDFKPGKNGQGVMPVLKFETEEKEIVTATASRITHIGYFLGNASPGNAFNAIYRTADPSNVRVHGFLHLIVGMFLAMPLMAYLAIAYSKTLMASQLSFMMVFAVIVLGGWILLKIIRRNY